MARRIRRNTISGSSSVSIYDVQEVLNTTDNSLQELCTHSSINKWAKYKPERSTPFTSDQIQAGKPLFPFYVPLDNATRRTHNYGLNVPYCENYLMNEKIYNIITGEELGWNYLKPRGGVMINAQNSPAAEFYRLSDFQGYDHDAKVPFSIIVENGQTGITYNGNDIEANAETATDLTFTILNNENGSSNLHIEDFIEFADEQAGDNDICLRPVIQIFNGYIGSDLKEWYQKDHPDKQFSGDPITASQSGEWFISLSDLPDFQMSDFIQENSSTEPHYICIGIGYCKKGGGTSIWSGGSGNKRLFLPPYNEQDYPYYYTFHVYSHPSYDFGVSDVYWYNTNSSRGDHGIRDYSTRFNIDRTASGALFVSLTFIPQEKLHFVSATTSDGEDSGGYKTFKVRFVNRYNGQTFDLIPVSNIEHGQNQQYQEISGNDPVVITALVNNFFVTNINPGETVTFDIKTKKNGQSDYTPFGGSWELHKLI